MLTSSGSLRNRQESVSGNQKVIIKLATAEMTKAASTGNVSTAAVAPQLLMFSQLKRHYHATRACFNADKPLRIRQCEGRDNFETINMSVDGL
jgi:hypothetical protein